MPVIPAPLRVALGDGVLRLGPDITVGYRELALAAVTERFCSDLERRTGIRSRAMPGGSGMVVVGLGEVPELGARPGPLGIHPARRPSDESYVLSIGVGGVLVRARKPRGRHAA